MACLVEVKAKDGRLSSEQQKLFDAGWSYVVWSVDGALEALEAFEEQIAQAFEEQIAQWAHWSHNKPAQSQRRPTNGRTEL
jgi:hypothetical protein